MFQVYKNAVDFFLAKLLCCYAAAVVLTFMQETEMQSKVEFGFLGFSY